jgi:hypothetical protein
MEITTTICSEEIKWFCVPRLRFVLYFYTCLLDKSPFASVSFELVGMMRSKKEESEVFRLLDEGRLDEAMGILKMFSKDELADLLVEALMLERVVKAKIRLLREELGLRTEGSRSQ